MSSTRVSQSSGHVWAWWDARADELDVDVELLTDTTLVWVGGEIDTLTVPALRRVLDMWLREGAERIVLDLQDVTFISGEGMELLFDAVARAREAGVRLRVVPSRVVARVSALLGHKTWTWPCMASVSEG